MSDKLKIAGFAAGLSPAEKKKIDDFNKALTAHRELSNLPGDVAKTVYGQKTPAQQQSLLNVNGEEDPVVKPDKGWLSTAWHYTGGLAGQGFGKLMAGLGNVSDFSTRLYRTGAIAVAEGVDLGTAWDEANDKGDKKFNPGRIENARSKFGNVQISVAMRIAAGESPDQIAINATPEEMKYLRLAQKTQGLEKDPASTGVLTKLERAEQDDFQDALDAVQAAKYSPGRQVANLLLPGQLEGSGFFYKAISGAVDAAYRVFADPLIIGGKVKRLYDVKKYAVDVIIGDTVKGGRKLTEYFAKPSTTAFWDEYGAKLAEFDKATKAGETVAKAAARQELIRLAPEFGPAVVSDFLKAQIPVTNAATAKAYFENATQVTEMMKGAVGRRRVLAPRLDAARKTRIAIATGANKVFNIDKMGSKFVDNLFFGGAATDDGIREMLVDGQKEISDIVKANDNPKTTGRFSTAMVQKRIDNFKRKFEVIPFFKDDVLDVTAVDAPQQMYRLARLVLPQRESRLISEAFDSMTDVNQRKDVFYGLWSTIADIRGLNATEPGQLIVRQLVGKGQTRFSVGRFGKLKDGSEVAIIPSDNSNFVSAPSLVDIDRAATRSGLIQRMVGQGNKDWVEQMTSTWSFLTLAGPRYAIRNATEDLMVGLAIGQVTPWGLVNARIASTRLNTARGMQKGLTKAERVAANPMGAVIRFVNKKEAESFAKRIDDIEENIAIANEEIKTLRNVVKSSTDEAAKAEARRKIAELRKSVKGGPVQQRRIILAQALNEGKLNRVYKVLGRKPLGQAEKDLLAEQILYGDLDNALEDIVEGGKNFAVGSDYVSRAVNFTRQHGVRSVALKIEFPRPYTKARNARGYTDIPIGLQNEASLVSWLMRISYYANDELGAIAVANLDDPDVVKLIFNWLDDPKNKKIVDAFRLESNGFTKQQHAVTVYKATRELFEKQRDGSINLDLLNKIRSIDPATGRYMISGKLSLDDLPTNELDVPKYVVGPTLVPVSESGNITSSLMEKGWTWLGLSNARLSREPLALAEMIKVRKQMRSSGFEEAFIKAHIKDIDPTDLRKVEAGTEFAKRKLAEIVEDRARLQILAYVDNPMVRSQLAFSIRNFARFYRAQEDFYRRMSRIVKYNPEAIVKAALTYEGIVHSGWVQKDDQGEAYFVYPGIEPVYRAVQGALVGLGIPAEFRVPLPVQFGAQLKMITPSLNPDSIIPTLAGPAAAVPMKVIANLVGVFDKGAADTITRVTLGKYAEGQSVLSAFLPAHINRLYSAMDRDERDSQYASAWRKAVTYLEASGNGIPKTYNPDGTLKAPTPAELEAYRVKVKNTVIGILGTRFVFGFFAPASPQIKLKSDMAAWVQDNGRANFKQVWNKLLDQYPGDYDKAMAKWVELYPDQIPFTVTESERQTVAYFRYAEESGNFVNQNKELFKNYPQAAAFLIPHKGGFSWDAYKTMTDMGLIKNKRVEDYLREVQTASDLQTYYEKKNEFEAGLEGAIDFQRTELRKEFNDWKDVFFAGRPLVAEELSQGSQKAINRLRALDDLKAMLDDPTAKVMPATQNALKKMLNLFNSYKQQKDEFEQFGGNAELIRMVKDDTIVEMQRLSEFNENTKAAYDVLFGSLLNA
jgi:hypothetical protein